MTGPGHIAWGIYLAVACVFLLGTWVTFTIDLTSAPPPRCPQCAANWKETLFARDSIRAMGPAFLTAVVTVMSLGWPWVVFQGIAARNGPDSHRNHATGR